MEGGVLNCLSLLNSNLQDKLRITIYNSTLHSPPSKLTESALEIRICLGGLTFPSFPHIIPLCDEREKSPDQAAEERTRHRLKARPAVPGSAPGSSEAEIFPVCPAVCAALRRFP